MNFIENDQFSWKAQKSISISAGNLTKTEDKINQNINR
jgi:hypothetical protein